jgi:hypothetical protein
MEAGRGEEDVETQPNDGGSYEDQLEAQGTSSLPVRPSLYPACLVASGGCETLQ